MSKMRVIGQKNIRGAPKTLPPSLFRVKETVVVILSNFPIKKEHIRFITVPLAHSYLINNVENKKDLILIISSLFLNQEMHKSHFQRNHANENKQFSKQKHEYLIHTFKFTV